MVVDLVLRGSIQGVGIMGFCGAVFYYLKRAASPGNAEELLEEESELSE